MSLGTVLAGAVCLGCSSVAASPRATALVSDFMHYCAESVPDFERMDTAAKTLNWPVKSDRQIPAENDRFARARSWTVPAATGSYELMASEGSSDTRKMETCGISAQDAVVEDVQKDLMTIMKLGEPVKKDVASADGLRLITSWKITVGADPLAILLVHNKADGPAGVYLDAVYDTKPAAESDAKTDAKADK